MKLMCRLLKISRQAYYDWLKRPKSQRAIDTEILRDAIRAVYDEFKGRYGSPRIALELCNRGIFTSKNRVARQMQQMGLIALPWRRKYRLGRKPSAGQVVDNLVKRVFQAQGKNKLWVGDITYIPLQNGRFVYLATYLDVFSRKVVGWALQSRMTQQLVIDAFEQAIGRERPERGLIVHTDRGSQFTSQQYQATLVRHGAIASMSRLGDPYDNAVMESFYKTLKTELLAGTKFINGHEANKAVFEYIELFYNVVRRHSSLGYKSPKDYELCHSVV